MAYERIKRGIAAATISGLAAVAGCKASYDRANETERTNFEIVAKSKGLNVYDIGAEKLMPRVYTGLEALASDRAPVVYDTTFDFDKYDKVFDKEDIANVKLLREATITGSKASAALDAAYVDTYTAANRLSKDVRRAGNITDKEAKRLYSTFTERQKGGFIKGMIVRDDYNRLLKNHPEINVFTKEKLRTKAAASGNAALVKAVEEVIANYDSVANGVWARSFVMDSIDLTEGYNPRILSALEAECRIRESVDGINDLSDGEGRKALLKVGVTGKYLAKRLEEVSGHIKSSGATGMDDILNKIRHDFTSRLNSARAENLKDKRNGVSGEEWIAGIMFVDYAIASQIALTKPEGFAMKSARALGRQLVPGLPGALAVSKGVSYGMGVPNTLEEVVSKEYKGSAEAMRRTTEHALLFRAGAQNLPNFADEKQDKSALYWEVGKDSAEQVIQALWIWATVKAAVDAHDAGKSSGSHSHNNGGGNDPDPWIEG